MIVGAAYKKNVNDLRESPSIKIFDLLKEKGAQIHLYDKYFDKKEIQNIFEGSVFYKKINHKTCTVLIKSKTFCPKALEEFIERTLMNDESEYIKVIPSKKNNKISLKKLGISILKKSVNEINKKFKNEIKKT